ncbi:MAG: UvrD-helicase domain-containing protein [Clostridia bacterium]|nr:UvrD-helicase domain-containing protein [Clostridia bacterium]
MAERVWTAEQLSAIEERSKTLLVSAAAGSGKTATLTERVIRSLTDEKNPVSIESLLCVTFTVAAAGELKAKLTRALEDACEKNPENARLRHQLNMLPSAKIRTIDSFCNDILRMGADRVGLNGGYRIADTAECTLLAISMLDGLIGAVYRGELCEVATPEEFEALCDCLTDSKRVEDLSEIFRLVYSKFDSSECGIDAMLPLIEIFNADGVTDVVNTPHGKYLLDITRELFSHYRDRFIAYLAPLSSGSIGEQIYFALCENDIAAVDKVLSAESYTELREAVCGFSIPSAPRMKKGVEKTPLMEDYAAERNALKADIRDKLLQFFIYTEKEWLDSLSGLHKLLLVLYRFEKKFDTLFLEEKKRRGALSYADIERLCYECLVKDGEPTDIAINLSNQFEAIYIDEYQDVNSLQNSIFKVISKKNNRFMVGDIKQSIYGFRLARPEIFAAMKASFPPLSEAEGDEASVFMSGNFRCDEGIVDFVNGIFDKIFTRIGESIGYEDGDKLKFSKVYDEKKDINVEYRAPVVCVCDGSGALPLDDEDEDESAGSGMSEAEVVAEKISELLASGKLNNGEAPRPSDIAIIIRSAKGKDHIYAEALEKRGIPAEISGAKSFFLSSEVLLALCLLNSIDNPRRDIYLAGLMCSPIFSFTADELYRIRRDGGSDTLWEDVKKYCEAHPDYERGAYFISRLEYYRTIAEGIGVDALISKLYRECGLMALASHNGGADNLTVLYDYARSYEAGAYKGLYNFINFINNIIDDKKTAFDDKRAGSMQDAVKIITCHSSKGLEYPIVFLCGANGRFSSQDTRPRLVYSADMGITFRQRTPSGLAVVESPIHDLNCHYILRKQHEEELRVLYVALTRAREQLYVVGKARTKTRDSFEEKVAYARESLSPYTVRAMSTYLDLITATMDGKFVYPEDFIENYLAPSEAERDEREAAESAEDAEFEIGERAEFDMGENAAEAVGSVSLPEEDPELVAELCKRFGYEYPRKYLTTLPEKLSVSRTTPHVLEEYDTARLLFTDEEAEEEKRRRLPAFVVGREAEESAKRGIATHMVLQFCDLERLAKYGEDSELDRLLAEGFISEEDKARVRKNELRSFISSRLFAEMRGAKKLWRELRFNVLLPTHIFTEDPEQREALSDREILVQGVIDCIVEYEDGTLGLYDYKTDRLTKEERENRYLAEAKLKASHTLQLSYYALAVEKMFGKLPEKVGVYSLPLGDVVEVEVALCQE